MSDDPRDPSLEHVFSAHRDAVLGSLYGALPGVIVSYDAATRRASVQPTIQSGEEDETGARVVQTLPILNDVPVIMPGTSALRIKFPINVGDGVLLVFVGVSMDTWKSSSGIVDPADDTRHNYTDCVAIPGLASFKDASEASAIIEFTAGNTVQIGGNNPLVTKSDFDSHVHTSAASGSPTTIPTLAASGTATLRG